MSCGAKKQLQTTQAIEVAHVSDTSATIHAYVLDLVAYDTIFHVYTDTTFLMTRHVTVRQTLVDTLQSASSSLRSDSASGRTEIHQTRPLMVQSNKGGQQGFAPSWLLLLLIFATIFVLWWNFVKKK